MTQAAAAAPGVDGRASIRNLPVNLFASVMGTAGLALAWQLAGQTLGAGSAVSAAAGALALLVYAAMALGYGAKALRHPDAVQAEFTHPVMGNFFGSIAIATLLVSSLLGRYSAPLQQAVWTLGVILTFAVSFVIVSRVLKGQVDGANVVPPWLIPGVATLDIAVTGATMPMAWAHQANLAAIAVGTVVALVFYALIFSRLVHRDPLPPGMTPSLMVLIAPFAVGFLAYVNLFGKVDAFAGLLFWFALFIFLVTAFKVFRPSVPFTPSWWAISFPLAALASAALKYAHAVQLGFVTAIAIATLALLSIVIAVLLVRTLHILFNGKLLGG